MEQTKSRQSDFELLRIAAMLASVYRGTTRLSHVNSGVLGVILYQRTSL